MFLLNKQTCSWSGSFPETAKGKAKFDLATLSISAAHSLITPSYLDSIKQHSQLSVNVVGEGQVMMYLQEAEAFEWSPGQNVEQGGAD